MTVANKPFRRAHPRPTQEFAFAGSAFGLDGMIRVRAPLKMSLDALLHSLSDGSYSAPFIHDIGALRRLQFDLAAVQSEMDLERPSHLCLPYTQLMMAFLLFIPAPKQLALVGLGGGSLTRFCFEQLPQTALTTLEIDQSVINWMDVFALPEQGRSQIIHADAAAYFAITEAHYDAVLIDGCDREGIAPVFATRDFYTRLRTRLTPDAMVVINSVGDPARDEPLLAMLGEVFEVPPILLPEREGNRIIFVFNRAPTLDWRALRAHATALETAHDLSYAHYLRRLRYRLRKQRPPRA